MGRSVLDNIPFVQCDRRCYQEATPGRHIQVIIMHTMEAPVTNHTANEVALWFGRGGPITDGGGPASAHWCVDPVEIVQCVQSKDVAYGAPSANRNGLHYELSGYAKETSQDWTHPNIVEMLKNAAWHIGQVIIPKYQIPIRFVDLEEMKKSHIDTSIKGISMHRIVSQAFHGTHTDPGPDFPMTDFLHWVTLASTGQLT